MNPADEPLAPHRGDALLLIDVQVDFLPGGQLAVPAGDRVLPALNRAIDVFVACGLPIVATRDWHPADHCSFVAQGGPWPPHCVVDTPGAAFASGLKLPARSLVVSKATTIERDERESYSGFAGTALAATLRDAGVERLVVGGLATDYCVLQKVLDALSLGFAAVVLRDGVAAVDVHPGDGERALARMAQAGARLVDSDSLTRAPQAPPGSAGSGASSAATSSGGAGAASR
ncbi:MAG: isochorismatase family protein [Betaproteobacteria bacterium]